MGSHVDGVIITAKVGETTEDEVTANVVGVMLIGVEDTDTYGRQYYDYRSDEITTRVDA